MNQSSSNHDNGRDIARLYCEHREMVFRYVVTRIPHKYEAEDLTQDVFLRLLECGMNINPATVKPLLLTIARNLVTDTLRKYYRKEDVMSLWEQEHGTCSRTGEDDVILHEIERVYDSSVQALPEKCRNIYDLMENDGLSIQEIASMLSLSRRTVESHVYNARMKVRMAVTEYLMVG